MDSVQKTFITNMKKMRNQLGYPQMKLAELSDLSTSFIAEIEAGKKFPSTGSIEKISKALGVMPYILFLDEADDPTWDKIKILTKISKQLNREISESIHNIIKEYFK